MNCYKFESKEQFRSLAAAEGLITTDDDGNESLTPGPFFRWPDEATGMAALAAAGLLNDDGEPITAAP